MGLQQAKAEISNMEEQIDQIILTVGQLEKRKAEKLSQLKQLQDTVKDHSMTSQSPSKSPVKMKEQTKTYDECVGDPIIKERLFTKIRAVYQQLHQPSPFFQTKGKGQCVMPMNLRILSQEHLLGTIEDRTRDLCSDFSSLMEKAAQNMTTAKYLQDAMKKLDIEKRDKKAEAAKLKEREETERRYLRNLEKLHKTDEVALLAERLSSLRVQKLRSRKPRKVKFVQKSPELTESQKDYQRYVENL